MRTIYEIKILGALRHDWSDWFSGLTISHLTHASGITVTTLSGKIDHSALQGILNQVFSMNLKLLSVKLKGFDLVTGEFHE
jgi:hypothetical protein